ncbi:MAG: glycosyltransferase family 4 protein [bacterium]|nr:glycosyltransferase family 4 protein [bacterium]
MKKILYFITQSEYGGAQRYVFDLAHNLKAEFQVAVALGEQGNNGTLAKILDKNNIKYYIIPHLKRGISPLNEIMTLYEIIKLIKQHQPDIIHLNSSKISILGSLAALIINIRVTSYELRVIYTAHGWVFNEPLPALIKYFYLFAEKFTARFKDKIICVSEFDRRVALKRKIAPAEKLITIHNGLAPVEFYGKEEAKKIILRVTGCELRVASLLIGSIGNLYPTKGFKYLIEAANILINEKKLLAAFIIIGEGAERKKLEQLIAGYKLKNNFILAGRIDQPAKLLPAFDLYACSSVKEGFPYSVLEAMQAGLPIVSTNAGGIPEMIEHEKTGLLSKPADAKALAENIKLLINNKNLRAELAAPAREKAKTEFSLKKMAEAVKKVYG